MILSREIQTLVAIAIDGISENTHLVRIEKSDILQTINKLKLVNNIDLYIK